MKDSIRNLVQRAIPGSKLPAELADLSEEAFGLVRQYVSKACANHLHHERQIEKLERKKGKVFARRMRLAHHRLWRRYWESRCEALNLCDKPKGC